MMSRFYLVVVLMVAIFAASLAPASADSFGRPDAGTPVPATPLSGLTIALPKPVRQAFATVLSAQRALNDELRAELAQVKAGQSWRPAAIIVLISFIYGVLHAIGPGHGKFVVTGYFLSRRARVAQGLAMSAAAAFVQALSAILWVGGLVVVLRISASRILSHAAALEMTSYGLIALLGASMIWNIATRRACCALADEPGHDHAGHDHDHDHEDTHHHHGPEIVAGPGAATEDWWRILATGAAVGLRPCSGAILVLLFTLANAIFPVGILATLAMGLGVAITVSAVSLGAVGARRLVPAMAGGIGAATRERAGRVMAYGGAILITAFGLFQAIGLWAGVWAPSFG